MIHQDLLTELLSNVQNGKTYKNILRLNKYIYKRFTPLKLNYVNQLITLMKLFPDKDWDWFEISRNPNIT
jgi:hypothetical protein